MEKSLWLYKACIRSLPGDLVVKGNVDSDLGFGDSLLPCANIPTSVRVGGQIRCE